MLYKRKKKKEKEIGKTVPNRKGGILCIMVLSVRKKEK